MKRSEINKALKELEKMIADHQYYLPKFANHSGRMENKKAMSLMKSVIICLDGILPTTAWEIFDKYGFFPVYYS